MKNGSQIVNTGVGSDEYFQEHYASRDWRFYKGILSEVVLYSDPGPILDLGAGWGLLVELFRRWNIDCIGIEGSSYAVKMASERSPRIDMRCQPLSEKMPFDDGHFGTVIMNQVIEHLEPVVALHCIEEAYRVLKPGGMLYVTSPSRFNKSECLADSTHINMYSPQELKGLLKSVGFERFIEKNTALAFLGTNKIGSRLMQLIYKFLKLDILSATANCIAFKR